MGVKLARLAGPILVVLASEDRVTDNDATRRAFNLLRVQKRLVEVPGEHGVQFDAPDQTAKEIIDWIARFDTSIVGT